MWATGSTIYGNPGHSDVETYKQSRSRRIIGQILTEVSRQHCPVRQQRRRRWKSIAALALYSKAVITRCNRSVIQPRRVTEGAAVSIICLSLDDQVGKHHKRLTSKF